MVELIAFSHDPESLVARYLDDPRPDLKDLILVEFSGLVERIARRFSGLEPFEDLVQVGYIGLLNALSKYDPKAGVRFNTYATHLVAGEIKHYLRDRSQTIRHPAWLQELRHRVNKATLMLQASLGRQPNAREIADQIGVSETAVNEVYATQEMLKVSSLDTSPGSEDDGESDIDKMDSVGSNPDQLSVEDRVVLEEAMKQLRDLERQVLVHFHFDAMNQTEIASKLGISCNYVSHILRQSLAKLRRILTSEDEQDRKLKIKSSVLESSTVDELTGIYNEKYFHARFQEEIHRASAADGSVAVMIVDFQGLDRMQNFYGEASVRDFVADASEFLRNSVRRLDIVCRFGETGFAVIMPSTGPAVSAAELRIVAKFEGWLTSRLAPSGPIRVQTGSAAMPDQGRQSRELIEIASRFGQTLSLELVQGGQQEVQERRAA